MHEPSIIRKFTIARGDILCATPFLEDQYIAGGSATGIVSLFPLQTGIRTRRLVGHRGPVTCLSVSRSPVYLVSGSDDATVRFWVVQGQDDRCFSIEPNDGPIVSIDISSDANRLMIVGKNSTPSLWDPLDQSQIISFGHSDEPITAVALNIEANVALAATSDGNCKVFDTRSGELARQISLFTHIGCMSMTADGKKMVCGGNDGNAFICDVSVGHIVQSTRVHQSPIKSISINPQGTLVVSGAEDATVIVSDSQTLDSIFTLTGHKETVFSTRFSSDGTKFTTCAADHTVFLWRSPVESEHTEEEQEEEQEEEEAVPEPQASAPVPQTSSPPRVAPLPLATALQPKPLDERMRSPQKLAPATPPRQQQASPVRSSPERSPVKTFQSPKKRDSRAIKEARAKARAPKAPSSNRYEDLLAFATASIRDLCETVQEMGEHMVEIDQKLDDLAAGLPRRKRSYQM